MTEAAETDEGDGEGDREKTEGFDVGHRRPPAATRFRKGQSGNPKGRPRGRKKHLPYEAVLGQIVTIREEGRDRRVTAEEAFLLHIAKSGLDGDGAAARAALQAIEDARDRRPAGETLEPMTIVWSGVDPGSVTTALEPLRMARRLDAFRETARLMLEPWLVEAALKRLGSRRLTVEEQETVLRATRTPGKVNWPAWWVVKA